MKAIFKSTFLGALLTAALTASTGAVPYTYDFTYDFGSSWALSNVNGRAPISGGTASGFFSLDVDGGGGLSVLDYEISTVQPYVYGADRNSIYDFDRQGVQENPGKPLIGPAAGKTSISVSGATLTLSDYDSGTFSGYTFASGYRILTLSLVSGLVGDPSLVLDMSERYGSCSGSFTATGPRNPCAGAKGGQGGGTGLAALRLVDDPVSSVPLPAGGLLLAGGLAMLGLAGGQRRRKPA